ncbi:MAG: cell envelope integrity protein TolA [Betaproteobacteria bacterium]|nr:cell envelope integrity protein TolA [Betaproteobacteria bacterium]NCP82725.1 cell envelope integrity protein TolA [Rhodoferax sp.]NCS61149.1 cell envelope integrity protein TolA [Rhodoferax sp.]OIP15365.1 MAG: protein TolA [Comamonadaceae bacterium CG2_30_57_122]PJC21450.1 MAG: protein TolA [Comamonadaceae bacterium CG_4_9_14_0_8_um_filter_57_21]
MNAAVDRLEFAPPPTAGLLRALLLALIAHALLVAALTWGVNWRRQAELTPAEAELWASVPVAAAPKLQEPPPEPPAVEPPPPPPLPPPEPVVPPPKVDIALEQEKQRKLKQRELEQQKLKAEQAKLEKAKLEKIKQEKAKADKLKQDLADKAKREQIKKQEALQAKQLEAQRQKNLQRIAGLAGASGGPSATGTALKSAGPSASYAGRIKARIKPNIVFTEDINGNPTAEVEVRTAPEGSIIGRKLLKSSGNKAWDDAVLRAIDKTEALPRDTDGRVPPVLVISFRPKD